MHLNPNLNDLFSKEENNNLVFLNLVKKADVIIKFLEFEAIIQ